VNEIAAQALPFLRHLLSVPLATVGEGTPGARIIDPRRGLECGRGAEYCPVEEIEPALGL